MIIINEINNNPARHHIILITDNSSGKIEYVHARAWNSEGKYGHGVSRGQIKIINPNGNLLEQQWEELGKINDENETYLEAKSAKILQIRRIKT